jgi:hypothetical protein
MIKVHENPYLFHGMYQLLYQAVLNAYNLDKEYEGIKD